VLRRAPARPQAHHCLDQLGFAEAGIFLRLTEEYRGGCPKVFDDRTDELLFEAIGETGQAIWVDPPKP